MGDAQTVVIFGFYSLLFFFFFLMKQIRLHGVLKHTVFHNVVLHLCFELQQNAMFTEDLSEPF